MVTEISDHIGDVEGVRTINALILTAITNLREIFREDPGNMAWSKNKVRGYLEDKLLDKLDVTRKDIGIKNATVAFTHNVVNDLNIGFYDISDLQRIEESVKRYALGYWRRIRCQS